jgi:hypothetical protein
VLLAAEVVGRIADKIDNAFEHLKRSTGYEPALCRVQLTTDDRDALRAVHKMLEAL